MTTHPPTTSTAPDHPQAFPIAEAFIVAAITILAAVASFYHEYELARRNGQLWWVAALLPFEVDGLILLGSVTLLWAAANQIRRPWRPWGVLAVGILATIGANLAADIHLSWLGPAVSAWPGVAVAIAGDMLVWLIRVRRQIAAGQMPQPAVACACPPPPVSLAEALPLARVELQSRGEEHGEQTLADRFKTTRHQVRVALSPPVEQSANGHGPQPVEITQ